MDYPQFKEEYHIPGKTLLPHRDPFLFVDELISADDTGAAIVARKILPEGNAAFLLAKVEDVRFRRPVRPGDTLYTVVKNVRLKAGRLGEFSMKGYVEGTLAAEATCTCVLGTMDNMK